MLTLDSLQIERQKKVARFFKQQEESRAALIEAIENKEHTVANDGDIATTSLEQQLGNPLSSQEFIRRVSRLNKNLIFEVSLSDPTKMGIYVVENRRVDDGSTKEIKRFIVGMERGFMPERSVRQPSAPETCDPPPCERNPMRIPALAEVSHPSLNRYSVTCR